MKWLCAALLALLLTGCKERQTTRLAFYWPGGSPLQVERGLAIPMELALNGMPGLMSISSISSQGQVELYVVWESPRGTDHTNDVLGRVDNVRQDVPISLGTPLLLDIPAVPSLQDGPPTDFLVVEPKAEAMKAHNVSDDALWHAVAQACESKAAPQEQLQRCSNAVIETPTGTVALTDLADLKIEQQPAAIVRYQGSRLSNLPAAPRPP